MWVDSGQGCQWVLDVLRLVSIVAVGGEVVNKLNQVVVKTGRQFTDIIIKGEIVVEGETVGLSLTVVAVEAREHQGQEYYK